MNKHIQEKLKEFDRENKEALLVGLTAILIKNGIHSDNALNVDIPAKVAKQIYEIFIKHQQKALEDIYQKGLSKGREEKRKKYCKYCGQDFIPYEKKIGCYAGIPPVKRSKYHRWVYEGEDEKTK